MTALDQYERLEALGLYTPEPDAQRRDVVLSIGNATLTIADHREVALAHWSLAAIERLNPGERPAHYSPGHDSGEHVETDDDTMIRAIEKVRSSIDRGRPHPGRLRARIRWGTALAVLIAAIMWLPGALIHTTVRIVPDAVRKNIGAELYTEIVARSGRACRSGDGQAALDLMVSAISPHGPVTARVLPVGPAEAQHLPGGRVLLNRGMVEDHESPHVPAGALLAGAERAAQIDPLIPLLRHLGIGATVRLMTSGDLPDTGLGSYAELLLTDAAPALSQDLLAARFRAADIPTAPYAYAIDITGETTLDLIEANAAIANGQTLLSDGQWVALQGICID
ncbi:MAG: hypothetical protein AAGK37_11440 [Pseudomonadota bacterium]